MKVSTTTPNGLHVEIDGADASQILSVLQALDKGRGAGKRNVGNGMEVVVGQPLRKVKSRRTKTGRIYKNKIGYTKWTENDMKILLEVVMDVDKEIKGNPSFERKPTLVKRLHLKRALQRLRDEGDIPNRVPRSVGFKLYEVRDWLKNGDLSTKAKPKFKKVAKEQFRVLATPKTGYFS
jgi:hypothetical protein